MNRIFNFKLFVRTFLILAGPFFSGGAFAWPETYSFVCGDETHKQPFDPNDSAGTLLNLDVRGVATKLEDDSKGARAEKKTIVYHIDLTIQDPKITGSVTPVLTKFRCSFREGLLVSMSCFDETPFYPRENPVNSMLLSLPAPDELVASPKGSWPAAVGVRTHEEIVEGANHGERYYDFKRELTCRVRTK